MSAPAESETVPWTEQAAADEDAYRAQLRYLVARSAFYREKLGAAGVESSADAGGLSEIAALPLTTKQELRATASPETPIGAHLCVPEHEISRIYSTSGTTGDPSYIPLTAEDVESWLTVSARAYGASGLRGGEGIVTTFGAGPFVAGAILAAFERLGLRHIPVGPGSSDRLLRAIELLGPDAVALTPSYAAHMVERAAERGVDLSASSVRRLLVAGEPGGGEPSFRRALEEGWGARVTEAMGVGDIGPSLFGECPEQDGMHVVARGFVHVELIDPEAGSPVPLAAGVGGELVLTHLCHRAAPLLRFRTRDHVVVRDGECPCGRTGPRIKCIGRTDDMLIVRGVNVFPSAVREVVRGFGPPVSGHILVRPRAGGVKQDPPLPVSVELAEGAEEGAGLEEAIADRLREKLSARFEVELVPWGSLERTDYKSTLIARPAVGG